MPARTTRPAGPGQTCGDQRSTGCRAARVSSGRLTGVVCGVRVEEVADPLMKKIRYLDKLVDELAKGKSMEKILRGSGS